MTSAFVIGGICSIIALLFCTVMLFETTNETSQTFYWIGIVVAAMVIMLCYVAYNKDGMVKRAICENFSPLEQNALAYAESQNRLRNHTMTHPDPEARRRNAINHPTPFQFPEIVKAGNGL